MTEHNHLLDEIKGERKYMYLYRVTFEYDKKEKIIESQEFFCADEFSQVYERAKQQESENYELIEIKRMVPVLGVIKSNEEN